MARPTTRKFHGELVQFWMDAGGYTREDAGELLTPPVTAECIRLWVANKRRVGLHHLALIRLDLKDLRNSFLESRKSFLE